MKHTKTTEIPAKTIEKVSHYTCDICGAKSDDSGNWSREHYEERTTDVSCSIGANYPSGGYSTVFSYDICCDCFNNKLVPWFESQKIKPRIEENDW